MQDIPAEKADYFIITQTSEQMQDIPGFQDFFDKGLISPLQVRVEKFPTLNPESREKKEKQQETDKEQEEKIEDCKHFIYGCKNGTTCRFHHRLPPPAPSFIFSLCYAFSGCKKLECSFAHSQGELLKKFQSETKNMGGLNQHFPQVDSIQKIFRKFDIRCTKCHKHLLWQGYDLRPTAKSTENVQEFIRVAAIWKSQPLFSSSEVSDGTLIFMCMDCKTQSNLVRVSIWRLIDYLEESRTKSKTSQTKQLKSRKSKSKSRSGRSKPKKSASRSKGISPPVATSPSPMPPVFPVPPRTPFWNPMSYLHSPYPMPYVYPPPSSFAVQSE
jgi:hypothetical protein